jgi:hypothetical protein
MGQWEDQVDRQVEIPVNPASSRNILQIGQLMYLKVPNPQKVALLIKIILITA